MRHARGQSPKVNYAGQLIMGICERASSPVRHPRFFFEGMGVGVTVLSCAVRRETHPRVEAGAAQSILKYWDASDTRTCAIFHFMPPTIVSAAHTHIQKTAEGCGQGDER